MVSTSDFGSENIGSSPMPPTPFILVIIYINKAFNKIRNYPPLVKVGVFFFIQDNYDRRKRYNIKATESQDR